MSEPVDELGEHATDDDEVALTDPDDYHRSQRLREIHKARRTVHNTFTSIDTWTDENTHNNQQGRLAHAITAYVVEILPILRQTNTPTGLPNELPWNTFGEFVTTTGYDPHNDEYASYQEAMMVFEFANQKFADIKPLVQPDEADEWEIET